MKVYGRNSKSHQDEIDTISDLESASRKRDK